MIDAKQAVRIAKEKALEMLETPTNLEEIQRDDYKGRDAWWITLSLPRYMKPEAALFPLAGASDPLQYKRFIIDAETGEFRAMTLRELSAP